MSSRRVHEEVCGRDTAAVAAVEAAVEAAMAVADVEAAVADVEATVEAAMAMADVEAAFLVWLGLEIGMMPSLLLGVAAFP